jgi:hypothetical protein
MAKIWTFAGAPKRACWLIEISKSSQRCRPVEILLTLRLRNWVVKITSPTHAPVFMMLSLKTLTPRIVSHE